VLKTNSFDGLLITVPFATGKLRAAVADQYRQLLDSHDPEDILVITGFPTSMTTFRELLDDEVPGAAVPWVTSLIVQATDVVNQTDDTAILSDAMQRELVTRFLQDRRWESDYFRRAAEQPSFESDIARLMETVAWQDVTLDSTQELIEVAEVIEEFHAWLDEHDHMERSQLISEAIAVLAETNRRDEIIDAEAILVVEFEEFLPLDRRYLETLASGLDLVCVAETDASVRRTWVEAGQITEQVSFSTERSRNSSEEMNRPSATAAYLARGSTHKNPKTGEVSVLAAETADEQLELVADEIERLREHEGWMYDDFAVALKQSGPTVTETIRAFKGTGIPTESATVTGFGDDPAVRELLHVVRYLAATDDVREAILSANPILDEAILASIEGIGGLAAPLRKWATDSNMKARIAEGTPPLDARAQFGNVNRVFSMVEFVENTDFIEMTWGAVATMLERAHEYAPQQNQTSATDLDSGIRVDHIQAVKNGSFRAVFLLNVVDEEYPGNPSLTRLFPRDRVSRMPDYPGVTTVEDGDVETTFPTDSTASGRPFYRYHAEHARRRLAVGAAAATDRLYFCLYNHEDTALEERVQPSRFLTDVYRQLPWVTEASTPIIKSERTAEEYLLSRIDRALADVRRANSQDVDISLDEFEADLARIQRLLDASGDRGDDLREALHARVDFAKGSVRRE
jgi:superfamily I DNA/RNA helicase